MFIIFFITGFILTLLCLNHIRKFKKEGKKKNFAYHFYKNSLEFLIPFVIVTSLYFILSLVISISSESASLQFLIQLEESLEKFKSYFSFFKLSPVGVFLVFVVLYVLGIIALGVKESKKLFYLFAKYQKQTRRIYIVIVLFCSFTLLGTQMGEPTNDLQIRIKTIRQDYADLCNETKEAITEEVAYRLYNKVYTSFPSSYQRAFSLPNKIESQANKLRDYYKSAQEQYGIRSKDAESILNDVSSRVSSSSRLKYEIDLSGEMKSNIYSPEPNPKKISYSKIKDSRAKIEQYRNSLKSRVITLLQVEGGKKVTSQIPKIFSSEFKTTLFRQWIETYPILEPVVDVFFNTLDKEIEMKVETAVDRLVNADIQSPDYIKNKVDEEASIIVEHKNIELPTKVSKTAIQEEKRLEKELEKIEEARLRIEQEVTRVENARIAKLIAQLSSPKEEVRINASEQLSNRGDKLNKAQVEKIINIMKYGKERWSKFLYRESHCRWFEYTSIKYYAADCLINMKSQYVNEQIVKEAVSAKENGKTRKRITDPGWICF